MPTIYSNGWNLTNLSNGISIEKGGDLIKGWRDPVVSGDDGAGREGRPRPGRRPAIDAWTGYLSVPTNSFTAATDLSIIACSSALSLNSITFSTPPAPSTVGTPTKYPFTPNSPFR